jgi:hypothetical protein
VASSFHSHCRSLAGLIAVLALGCAEENGPRKITETREATVDAGSYKVNATSRERFGESPFANPHGAGGGMGAGPGGDPHGGGPELEEIDYDLPNGWLDLPPNEMRRANVRPAGNPEADCYLSKVRGGIAANVDRWRGQFGLEASAGISDLPKQPLLGAEAVRVELEGDFKGMVAPGGDEPVVKRDYALVGLIAQVGEETLCVKFTGPKAVVAAEKANFDAWVKSLRKVEASEDGVRFTAPDGWTLLPAKPMRLVTFRPAGTTASECYVSVLTGDGGGLAANLDRWCSQMSLPSLKPAELDALPRIRMLGTDAIVADWTGAFEDTMNQRKIADARFLGAIAIVEGRAVFVKLTGPKSEVDDKVREGFLSLCASLQE